MKLQNFKFNKDLISVDIGGTYIDLHNNYDFVSVVNKSNQVELHWKKAIGEWVYEGLPESVIFKIVGVSYFEFRGTVESILGLEEFGFFLNTTLGKVEYNGLNQPTLNSNVLVIRFVGGAEVAIIGCTIECSIN